MTTLDTPVSKAIAQRLKDVGFDAKTGAFYLGGIEEPRPTRWYQMV
jgi:hypothetical protein